MSLRPLAVVLLLSALGCRDAPPNPPVGLPPGATLGATCGDGVECRAGLTCGGAGTCEGSRSIADGSACVLGVECQSGHCTPNGTRGVCAPTGPGVLGSSCKGDANCAAPLKCGFDGQSLFPRCLPAGTKDVGGECVLGLECAQGLVCATGRCAVAALTPAQAPDGVPPVLPPAPGTAWTGATCEAPKEAATQALFELPRPTDAEAVRSDFYRLPFPNDALRGSDGRVDFSRHPRDPAPMFGFDAVGRYLEALAPEPFGNAPTVILRFDGALEFRSITLGGTAPSVRLVKLTTSPTQNKPWGLALQLNGGRNRYVCENWMSIRPYDGDSLAPGPWGVVVLKTVKGKGGVDLAPSPDFVAMLSDTAPTEARQAEAWPKYAPLRAYLRAVNIATSDVLTATVFTVEDPRRLVNALAARVATEPVPAAQPWVKCGSGMPSPCPDVSGARACGASTNFEEWHTVLELPVFQEGTAPYLTPTQGGAIALDGGVPEVVRREQVCAALTVPVGQAPDGGWPLVVYAHGTGGSFRSHAQDGAAVALGSVTLTGVPDPQGAAVLGFDQVGHGPRRGAAGQGTAPDDIVFNFANPASGRGTMAQGAADLHGVLRYVKSLATTPAAELPSLDVAHVAFWGHSQGATEGALFLPGDRAVAGALLSGASATLVHSLTSKKAPVNIADGLHAALGEPVPAAVSVFHPVLGLLQAWTDPVDPLHFAAGVATIPAEGMTPAKGRHVLQVWGKDDLFTPSKVQTSFALASRLLFVGPMEEDYGPVPETSARGNANGATAAVRQYLPDGYDGHFVVFANPTARTDGTRFLGRVLRGETPLVPE